MPPGVVHLVALALLLPTLFCSLQAPLAIHALLLKDYWRMSWFEMYQTLIGSRSYRIGILGWVGGLWDYEVLLKLPK